MLAHFPRIGRLVDELAAWHRRYRFQTQQMSYTEEADHIVIRAIHHNAGDMGLRFLIDGRHGVSFRDDVVALPAWQAMTR